MNTLLEKTLNCVERESPNFDASFELVDQLLASYGDRLTADCLYADIDSTVKWKTVADLIAIMIWSTPDNGHSLTQVTDRWLVEKGDIRKIQIAINLDVYPFLDPSEMDAVFASIQNDYPQLKAELVKMIESRKRDERKRG